MIARVAVVPHPPLLVPELVPGAEQETAPVRDAALEAVSWLRDAHRHWLAVGAHDGTPAEVPAGRCGSFAGYGVDIPVTLSAGVPAAAGSPDLPLPALVAAWLRDQAGAASVRVKLISTAASRAECEALGHRLRGHRDDVGLLVLGDGSHRHGCLAPGRPDDRSSTFDDSVATALKGVDTAALLALDPGLAAELGAVGRAPWQVLAGLADGGRWRGDLLYSDAPFGVAYHVAVWERG
ncbi:MAG: class III extradiol dioxygenase subunit B-like domain-containing protein [Pseudonocardiaceae bacterium]